MCYDSCNIQGGLQNRMSLLEIMKKKLLERKAGTEEAVVEGQGLQGAAKMQRKRDAEAGDNDRELNVTTVRSQNEGGFKSGDGGQQVGTVGQIQKEAKMKQLRDRLLGIAKQSHSQEVVAEQSLPFEKERIEEIAHEQDGKEVIMAGSDSRQQKLQSIGDADDLDQSVDQHVSEDIGVSVPAGNRESQDQHHQDSEGLLALQLPVGNVNRQDMNQDKGEQAQRQLEANAVDLGQQQSQIQNSLPKSQIVIPLNEDAERQEMEMEMAHPLPPCSKRESKHKKILLKQIEKISRLSAQIRPLLALHPKPNTPIALTDLGHIVNQIKQRLIPLE